MYFLVRPSSPTNDCKIKPLRVSCFETAYFYIAFYMFRVCLLQPTIFFKLEILTYQMRSHLLPSRLKRFTIFEQKKNFVMYGMRSLLKLMVIQDKHDVIMHFYKTM